jgi:hypothetical protein
VSVHKWPFSPCAVFSAGFDLQRSPATPAVKTLVRPCPEKKCLTSESDTDICAHLFFQRRGWALGRVDSMESVKIKSEHPAKRKNLNRFKAYVLMDVVIYRIRCTSLQFCDYVVTITPPVISSSRGRPHGLPLSHRRAEQ